MNFTKRQKIKKFRESHLKIVSLFLVVIVVSRRVTEFFFFLLSSQFPASTGQTRSASSALPSLRRPNCARDQFFSDLFIFKVIILEIVLDIFQTRLVLL